jgi:hypothetical protein
MLLKSILSRAMFYVFRRLEMLKLIRYSIYLALLLALTGCNGSGGQANSTDSPELVSLSASQPEYNTEEPVVMTLTTAITITTYDQRSFCSILHVQRMEGGEWQEAGVCMAGPPPGYITLPAGATEATKLPTLLSGRYRASVDYSVGEGFDLGKLKTVVSEIFTVR